MTTPFLRPEDYLEPACPLCGDPGAHRPQPIPIARVIEKLDEHIAARDTEAALRHIGYWIAEARQGRDEAGELTLLNEKMGVLRNAERFEEALQTAEEAIALLEKIGLCDEAVGGTTYLNAGTVCSAAGLYERALSNYERAEEVYEKTLENNDARRAGLFNNKAVVLCRLGRCDEAREAYLRALKALRGSKNELLESAVTYTNLANLCERQYGKDGGEEQIAANLHEAKRRLDDPRIERNGYAAFVFEKCAPTFSYYGWMLYANELTKRAKAIYEGT